MTTPPPPTHTHRQGERGSCQVGSVMWRQLLKVAKRKLRVIKQKVTAAGAAKVRSVRPNVSPRLTTHWPQLCGTAPTPGPSVNVKFQTLLILIANFKGAWTVTRNCQTHKSVMRSTIRLPWIIACDFCCRLSAAVRLVSARTHEGREELRALQPRRSTCATLLVYRPLMFPRERERERLKTIQEVMPPPRNHHHHQRRRRGGQQHHEEEVEKEEVERRRKRRRKRRRRRRRRRRWIGRHQTAALRRTYPLVPRVQKIKIRNLTLHRLLIVEYVMKIVYLGAHYSQGLMG